MLERGFLVLEETVRLANAGGGSDDGDDGDDHDHDDGDDHDHDHKPMDLDKAEDPVRPRAADDTRSAWSEASRSLLDPDSSTGSGPAKGSESASLSTASLRDAVDARQPGPS